MQTLKHIDHDRKAVRKARAAIQREVGAFLTHLRAKVVASVSGTAERVKRDDRPRTGAEIAVETVEEADWQSLMDSLRPHIEDVSRDGAEVALTQVAQDAEDFDKLLAQANENAIAWADKRAGELVGMKRNAAGDWIENPNRRWAINDTTRDAIRKIVTQSEEEGWSGGTLAHALEDAATFDDSRAEMVARTEAAFADTQGNVIGWRASGVVAGKQWSVNPNEDPCDKCLEMDGIVVGIDEEFDEGDPPLHPRCECLLLPVVEGDDEGDDT